MKDRVLSLTKLFPLHSPLPFSAAAKAHRDPQVRDSVEDRGELSLDGLRAIGRRHKDLGRLPQGARRQAHRAQAQRKAQGHQSPTLPL